MTMDETIKRINELYHLSKERELNPEEKKEQQELRQVYIASVRGNLQSQLDNMYIKNADGTLTKVTPKNKK